MMKTDEHVRSLSDYVLRLALLRAGTKNNWSCPRGYGPAITRLLAHDDAERKAVAVVVARIVRLRASRIENRPTGDALLTWQIQQIAKLQHKRRVREQVRVDAWASQVRLGIPRKWATIVHIEKHTPGQPRVEFHNVRAGRSIYQRRHGFGNGTRWEVTVRVNQSEMSEIILWCGKDCMSLGGFIYMKQIPDRVLITCNLTISSLVSRWAQLDVAEQNAGLAARGVALLTAINAAPGPQLQQTSISQTSRRIIEL